MNVLDKKDSLISRIDKLNIEYSDRLRNNELSETEKTWYLNKMIELNIEFYELEDAIKNFDINIIFPRMLNDVEFSEMYVDSDNNYAIDMWLKLFPKIDHIRIDGVIVTKTVGDLSF
jgi:hypothetical protein